MADEFCSSAAPAAMVYTPFTPRQAVHDLNIFQFYQSVNPVPLLDENSRKILD